MQHNGQKKKCNRTNNDPLKHTHKTKDRVTWTPLKTGGELRCYRMVTDEMKILSNKPRNKIYYTVGTSNRNIVERGKMDSHITQIHERSLLWHGKGTSIKSDEDKLGLLALLVFPCSLCILHYNSEKLISSKTKSKFDNSNKNNTSRTIS